MRDEILFAKICSDLKLGILTEAPIKLCGGFMHKMFKIKTSCGVYAMKILNPIVMERPDVFNNFNIAEMLEKKLQLTCVPIVPALEFNGTKMQYYHGTYYYIFDWVNGQALKSEEITKKHCSIIGKVLAQIHNIEKKGTKPFVGNLKINWAKYIELAKESCSEIVPLITENLSLLIKSQEEGNEARNKLPSILSICHGDMDSKNVLWENGNPKIIDLECLHYGSPHLEFFELALCWSGFDHCQIDFGLLAAFTETYLKECDTFKVDLNVLYSCNNGRLEWLEYNVKRALMIECENEEERRMGIAQVKKTMEYVVYYNDIRESLIKTLKTIFPFQK